MTQVVVDDTLKARLHGLTDAVALLDESGRLLGHFVPATATEVLPRPGDGCPYSTEELGRFRQESGGRPLADIWKSLDRP